MKILGLNGFTAKGKIDHYFTSGCFPYKRNWTPKDKDWALSQYNTLYQDEPFICICFSDGGTIGHTITHTEQRCKGLIAHSATRYVSPPLRNIPILLLSTEWDITGMGLATQATRNYYHKHHLSNIDYYQLPRNKWHGHEFNNAFGVMSHWAKQWFNYELPLK